MLRRLAIPFRSLVAVAALLAVAVPAVPALGQPTSGTATISIDAPTDGATVTNGTAVGIGGWAADPGGSGTGVDTVRVYLDNRMDAGGTLLGDATYGTPRPDVAAALGTSGVTNSGFNLSWTPSNVSAGQHTLYVYARSTNGSWSFKTVNVSVQAAPTPTPAPTPGRMGPGMGMGPQGPGMYGPPGYPGMGPGGYPGGYPGMYPPPMYPPMYPGYPGGGYPPYDPNPGDGGRVCIMIYPPPPGC
jgi:hypothetical protein